MIIKKLSEVRDENGILTHQMCCLCFEFILLADLYVDKDGQKWDECKPCGEGQEVFGGEH